MATAYHKVGGITMPEPTETSVSNEPVDGTFSLDPEATAAVKAAAPAAGTDADKTTPPLVDGTDPLKGKFQAHFSKELQTNPELLKHVKLDDLGKAYLEQAERLKVAIVPPKEGAPQEEVDAYLERLGRPKEADAYKLNTEIPLPAELKYQPEGIADFKRAMFDIGATQQQAEKAWALFVQTKIEEQELANESIKQIKADRDATLRREPGWNTEEGFKANLTLADRAVNRAGGKEAWEYFRQVGYVADPVLIKIFAKLGGMLSNDSTVQGTTGGLSKETPRDPSGYPMLFGGDTK